MPENPAWPRVSVVFPEHYAAAATVLARAFLNDPLLLAVAGSPDPVDRLRRLDGLFNVALREHRNSGHPLLGVFDHGRLVCAAVVEGLDRPPASATILSGLPYIPALLSAVRFGGLIRVIKLVDALARNHPPEPHLYLNLLGVDPDFQGRHCGVAILDYLRELVVARNDIDGVYLETATESNVAFYSRNQYKVLGEFHPLDVRMWRMFQPRLE